MMTDHPELFDGMRLVPCAVMPDNDNPQAGWLFIPHADGKWVSAAKLQPFSQQIINYWWSRPSSAEVMAEEQEPVYAYRRKGLEYFCTCDEARYNELAQKPNLFEVTTFYTAPQPPAPCPKCAENASFRLLAVEHANVTANEALRYQKSIRDLQVKASEQRAEIERLNRGMTVYTEAFEAECRTTDEQSALIEKCGASIELFLERVEAPDASCSCCISPPCNDCVEYGGLREALQGGKEALAAIAKQ